MRWRARHALGAGVALAWLACCSTYGRDVVTTVEVHDDGGDETGAPGGADAALDSTLSDDVADSGDEPVSDAGGHVIYATADMFGPNELFPATTVCSQTASAAHIDAGFYPWLSYSSPLVASPSTRLVEDGPWFTTGGDLVAKDRATLLSGVLSHGIDRDEHGKLVMGLVWTGTATNGTPSGNDCKSWTSGSATDNGSVGNTGKTDALWTNATVVSCASNAHVYCIQEP
jgi:hypothetical protein